MNKRLALKRVLVGIAFLGLFLAGYVATSVKTSCQADAQLCCTGGPGTATDCISIFFGVGPAMAVLDAAVVAPGVLYATASITLYYLVSMAQFAIKVIMKTGTVINNWVGWWDSFWYYDMSPALQDMTKQLQVMDSLQARAIGGFKDAVALNRAIAERRKQQIESRIEVSPGENVCTAGSLSGGMNKAQVLTEAYNVAVTQDHLMRVGNAAGTPAASGHVADLNDRYVNYCGRYFDPGDNGGYSGCPTGPPPPSPRYRNADLDVPGRIFQRQTIPVKDREEKVVIDDLIRNIAAPFADDLIPSDAFTSPQGQKIVLDRQSDNARRMAAIMGLYLPVSRRIPSSGLDDLVREIHAEAGVASDSSESPSKNEVMEVLTVEKNRTPMFGVKQIDEPNNNRREAVIQAGIRTRQLSDILDLTDRMSLIVASQVGLDLETFRPMDDQSAAMPKR
jgi:hypothetical protein